MPEAKPSRTRRRVLVGVAAILGGLAGCVGTTSESPPNSETEASSGNSSCIRVFDLSSGARTEVQTAIETGEFDACGNLQLLDEIDLSEDPVILSEGTAYEPVVAHGDAGPQAECSSTYALTMEQSNRDHAC